MKLRRIRYFGPWRCHDGRRSFWGWRVVIEEGDQRLDRRGYLLDVVAAAVDFPDVWR